jgi:ribosome maturation factor RimP
MAALQRDRLAALIAPAVEEAGFDLEAVTVSQAGRRSLVKVVVDGADGVSLDDIAAVSRLVSGLLDGDDTVAGSQPYVLEVTSPGVDRPLTQPRHWARAAGRLVEVPVDGAGGDGTSKITGRVVRADGEGVLLDVAGEHRSYGYGELGPGRVQIEFNRPQRGEEEQ